MQTDLQKLRAPSFVGILIIIGTLLAGCSTAVRTPGSRLNDHAQTVELCGVGNYTFYSLRTPCPNPRPMADDTREFLPAHKPE